MATQSEVESFLNDFKAKSSVFGIVYTDREKNLQGLFDLEINAIQRTGILMSLTYKDHFKGPNRLQTGQLAWEFGRMVNDKEAYIKITMGELSRPTICVSFHLAENEIKYPYQ